jgi:hypothetical protein
MESRTVRTPYLGLKVALVELDTNLISPATNTPSASSSVTQQTAPPRTRKQALNSSDPLYASLRDVNFAVVGTVLNRVARRLSDDYEVLLYYRILIRGSASSKNSVSNQRICWQADWIASRTSVLALTYFLNSILNR